jgi:hypothetical protein
MNMDNGTDTWKKIADDNNNKTNETTSLTQNKSTGPTGRNDTLVSK